MQVLLPKEVKCAEKDHVSYEIEWTVPNWKQVRQDVSLVRKQKGIFETGLQPTRTIQTMWLVGFEDVLNPDGTRRIRVYWQLLDIKGSGSQLTLNAEIQTTLCSAYPSYASKIDEQIHVGHSVGRSISEKTPFLEIGPGININQDFGFINSNGAIQYKLLLTFKIRDNNSDHNRFKRVKMEQFSERSYAQLRENLGTLLNQDSNGDLKIVASDGVELHAYQNILKVQCPVFAGMLNSDLSESKTGIVKVEDISGKTMKILLHYFYTGDLLNGWNDPDTIVEFTYAAGKYQMTQVLELLDDIFGRSALSEVSNLDVQLLSLTGKLSLENAEKRLLQQIIAKVAAVKSGKELFQLFGFDSEEIYRKAGILADEKFGESKALQILDYTVGNTNQRVEFSEDGLVLLAFVQKNGGLKGLEQILLKQVAEITSKFTTAEELMQFFGGGD